MHAPEAVRLADEVADIAGHLKENLERDLPRGEVFQEIFTLRRSVERLEQQVREGEIDTLGDAC